jgi:hypothetical protein
MNSIPDNSYAKKFTALMEKIYDKEELDYHVGCQMCGSLICKSIRKHNDLKCWKCYK